MIGEVPERRARRGRAVAALVYAYLKNGRLNALTRLPPVRSIHRRLAPHMTAADVLEIAEALERGGVHYWLAGGWGVDALVGRRTRDHRDLDLVIDGTDTARAVQALRSRGFRHVPAVADNAHRWVPGAFMPHRELMHDSRRRTVDLHPVDVATWPGEELIVDRFAVGALDGRELPCLSAAAQRAAHEGFVLTEAHLADLRTLDELVRTTP